MGKKLAIAVVILLVVIGIVTALWMALDWPPPRLILKYGLPPQGVPTGRTKLFDGMEFVELSPGYCHVVREILADPGDILGRVGSTLGLPVGRPPLRHPLSIDRWAEVREPFWISRRSQPATRWNHLLVDGATRRFNSVFPTKTFASHETRVGGALRRAREEELYLASARGVFGSNGYEVESINVIQRVAVDPALILFGTAWQGFRGSYDEAVEKGRFLVLSFGGANPSSVTHTLWDLDETFRLVWIPPEGGE